MIYDISKATKEEVWEVCRGLAATNAALQNVIGAFVAWRHVNSPTVFYGWYDTADQPREQPSFDPPHNAPCPYCLSPIDENDIRTHAIMLLTGVKTCDAAAPPELQEEVTQQFLRMITADEALNAALREAGIEP